MGIIRKIVLILLFVAMLPSTATGMGSKPADDNIDTQNSTQPASMYKAGDCFIRNNCKGNAIANLPSLDECVRRNGNSWVNEQAQCISDIDQN